MEELLKYIYKKGHRKIAYIHGQKNSNVTRERLTSFYRTMEELHIKVNEDYIREAAYLETKGESCPFRCINRLDRDTSGALILAKNALSAAILSVQMRNRQISRTYLAVVEGIPRQSGTISAPISRAADSVIERRIDFENGESAITHYQLLEVKNNHSLLEIHLETGRTHQIRVHMGYIGHPLPADYLYNPVYDTFKRQPLHSLQLKFCHPITGTPMCLMAPVPEDMSNAF